MIWKRNLLSSTELKLYLNLLFCICYSCMQHRQDGSMLSENTVTQQSPWWLLQLVTVVFGLRVCGQTHLIQPKSVIVLHWSPGFCLCWIRNHLNVHNTECTQNNKFMEKIPRTESVISKLNLWSWVGQQIPQRRQTPRSGDDLQLLPCINLPCSSPLPSSPLSQSAPSPLFFLLHYSSSLPGLISIFPPFLFFSPQYQPSRTNFRFQQKR